MKICVILADDVCYTSSTGEFLSSRSSSPAMVWSDTSQHTDNEYSDWDEAGPNQQQQAERDAIFIQKKHENAICKTPSPDRYPPNRLEYIREMTEFDNRRLHSAIKKKMARREELSKSFVYKLRRKRNRKSSTTRPDLLSEEKAHEPVTSPGTSNEESDTE